MPDQVDASPMTEQAQHGFTPWDNPMGTDGFEFIEFAATDPDALGRLFEQLGFTAIARHRQVLVCIQLM